MDSSNEELQEEQLRVDNIATIIQKRIQKLQGKTGGMKGDIISIRRDFWDDVTVNFEDAAETAETYASMKQQAELLAERETSHRHMEAQLATLNKLAQSPYFGRVDIVEEENVAGGPERIYLGIGSLLDESEDNYLIYDWRAPVSSLYYDYGPGPVQYSTPGGSIRGEMTLKRQFIIRDASIRSMFDTGVTIGDELLQEVLGNQSDAQMKSIVATIQQEQNLIIRNERARLLIVQGAAGSGKTSAALQRAAYLLYRFRGHLSANQIVLFSPNPMFNSYVSTVLPELGEENLQQTTYQQYLEHRLGEAFVLEDPFIQMEYTLTAMNEPEYETRMISIPYKSNHSFINLIDDYVIALGDAGLIFSSIQFRGRTLIASEAITEHFYKLDRTISIAIRMRRTAEWMLKELTRLGKLERKKKWVEVQLELLDRDDYANAFEALQHKNKFTEHSFNDYTAERDYLAAMIVQKKFKKLRNQTKRLAFLDVAAIYRGLFEREAEKISTSALPEQWNSISKMTLTDLEQGTMRYEDATPYLYLKEKLEGFHTNTTVQQVFIDEAQDYSIFQFHYLKRLFPNCRMTVLGDLNQSIFVHTSNGDSFKMIESLYEQSETEKIVLTRSYRSTKQIVDFTSRMIAGGELIEPFNRSGLEPTITAAQDEDGLTAAIHARLINLLDTGYASIAVICKTAAESLRLYDKLSLQLPQLRLVQKETTTFEKGILIIPAYLAKGVEFDAVVISNASKQCYEHESVRKLFYTACTRAMHELHLYYKDEITPFLKP